MALIKADRVKETSTSTGTGTFALAGAATGYRTFSSVCAIGDTFYYAISNQSNGEWESGLGTYSAANTLTRTTVHASSNSGNAVTFSAGTKEVFLTLNARHLDRINDNGQSTAIGSKTSVVAVNDSATLPDLDLQFADLKTLTAKYGPTPSYSRASTGTYFNASGVLTSAAVNEPRFDHVYENGAWVSKGLLIEEQRTNVVGYSEQFDNAYWNKSGDVAITANQVTAPDGTLTGDLLKPVVSNLAHYLYRSNLSYSAGSNTLSLFVKYQNHRWIVMQYYDGGPQSKEASFDLLNGATGAVGSGTSSSIVNVGNGWYRISITSTNASSTSGGFYTIALNQSDSASIQSWTPAGTESVAIWGAQLEAGSFATSYIPTTTSSVTRSADVCQITGSAFTNLWNATEGSIVLEQDLLSYSDPAADQRYFAVAGGYNSPGLTLHYDGGSSFYWERYFNSASSLTLSDVSAAYKVAIAFKTNDYATTLNGSTPVTATSPAFGTNFAKMDIGYQVGATARSSWIQRVRYFRSRLDNTQLVNLSGGINTLAFKPVTGSGSVTVANEYTGINISVPNPLPITNGGTGAQTQLNAVTNLVGNPPNDGGQYTLASKKTSGTPTFYWVDGTGYAPTLDLLFAADKSLTAYKGPTPTFSRASSGSYFDSAGVLRIQGYNHCQYSEDLTNAFWSKSLTTIISNAITAPDGKLTADKIVETQDSGFHIVYNTTFNLAAPSTASVYLKAGERKFASIEIVDNFRAVINLLDGTVVSNTLASSTVTTENVGNGWWRVRYTTNSSNLGRVIIYPLPTSTFGSYSGDGSSGIYAWGVQVEVGSVANQYSPTTSAANSAPRFNHTFNGTSWVSRGLLAEEQRTNSAQYSEDFTNAYWTKAGLSVSGNNANAPDGNLTADKFVETTANSQHTLYNSGFSVTSGTAYTISFFAKAAGRNFFQFPLADTMTGAGSNGRVNFDLSNGTITQTVGNNLTSEIVNVGNGWYRCICKLSSAASSGTGYLQFNLVDSGTATPGQAYLGDGTSGVLVWGIQLEAGSAFATSYIPSLSNSSTTRSADVCQITGSDFSGFWNVAEGSFAVELDLAAPTSGITYYPIFVGVSDAATNNKRIFFFSDIPPGDSSFYVHDGASSTSKLTVSPFFGNTATNKAAMAYKTNDLAFSLNGSSSVTDTSQIIPTGLDRLQLGSNPASNYFNGHIARLRYYPVRLPNATLQVLST